MQIETHCFVKQERWDICRNVMFEANEENNEADQEKVLRETAN